MLQLNDKEWGVFRIDEIADIYTGKDIYADQRTNGNTPYVTSSGVNNGIGYFVGNTNSSMASNAISVNRNGTVGMAFYHRYPALYSNDCRRIVLKESDDPETQLFIAQAIAEQRSAFSYSRKLGSARLACLRIMLPIDESGSPDYSYMHDYIRNKIQNDINSYRVYLCERLKDLGTSAQIPGLSQKQWGVFFVRDLFAVSSGKRLENRNKHPGSLPFVGATTNNNGVTGFISNKNESLDGNLLGVNYNGTPCTAFYHPYTCVFSDDVKRLHLLHHEDNMFVCLFFAALFQQQQSKFNYGYKFNERRMLRQKLMVPVAEDGEPDYLFMEMYMKNLLISRYNNVITYLDRM